MILKKTIYHSQSDATKAGRTIRALLAFMTAGRYSLIFSFKITLIKRNYNEHRMRQRVLENIFMCLVFAPIIIGLTMYMERCNTQPTIIEPCDSIQTQHSTNHPCTLPTLRHGVHMAEPQPHDARQAVRIPFYRSRHSLQHPTPPLHAAISIGPDQVQSLL